MLNVTKNLTKIINLKTCIYSNEFVVLFHRTVIVRVPYSLVFFHKKSAWVWHCFTSAFLFTACGEDMYVNVILHSNCWSEYRPIHLPSYIASHTGELIEIEFLSQVISVKIWAVMKSIELAQGGYRRQGRYRRHEHHRAIQVSKNPIVVSCQNWV